MDGTDVSEQTNLVADRESAAALAANGAPPTPLATEPSAPVATASPPADENGDGELDAASLMEQFLSDPSHDYKSLKYGDVMDGIIMHVDREELLVDIGSKSEGVVPAREYSSLTQEEKQALSVGDTILVFVVQPENQEGHAVVSIDRARQEKSWRRLQEQFEANEVIEAEVTNYNKGGLLVNLDGVRGFVPASQVTEIRGGDDASKQADMARLIGTMLPLKVIEINRHRNRLILSERQAVQERRDVMKERLIEELKEGEVRKGRVSSICDFGAFVDIGGADGLVHLSELSWSRVRHPSEVLRVGQEVDVYVLGINAQEKKIALSIKRTQAEPWSRVAAKYEVGQLVRGAVTQLANFGAFARIEDGIEGLIHVSELVDERVTHPKQVVSEGEELLLRIIRIDPQRRRMGLSLRRALDTPDGELVGAFGPEVLEERDALVQLIRTKLEAEGIDIGSALSGGTATDEGEAPATDLAAVAEAAPAPEDTAVETETPEARQFADPAPVRSQPQPPRQRPAAPTRPAVELPADLDGEPLSAMAMAFAMAGAPADLASDEATDEAESAPEPREAPLSAVAADSATDTGGSSAEVGATSEGDGNDDASGVGAVAGAIASRLGSVAEAVTSRVADVVEAIKPDGDQDADAATDGGDGGAAVAPTEDDGNATAR